MEDAPWSLGFPSLQNKAAPSLLSAPYVVACDFPKKSGEATRQVVACLDGLQNSFLSSICLTMTTVECI